VYRKGVLTMTVVLSCAGVKRWVCGVRSSSVLGLAVITLLTVLVVSGSPQVSVKAQEQPGHAGNEGTSSAPPSESSDLASRIVALKPSQYVSGGARFVRASLLGYDLVAPPDAHGTPHVVAGETYTLVLYLEIKDPGDLRFDVVVRLGDVFIARQSMKIAQARPGEVLKKEIQIRIPLTAPAGQTFTSFSILDTTTPVLAGGGAVVVENRRAPLVSANRDVSCGYLTKGNLVPNPSFEDDLRDPNWTPAEWRKLFGYSQVIDNCDAHCGTHSLMVDFHGGIDVSAWSVSGVEIPVTPGRKYRIGFYCKTQDLPKVPEGQRGPCIEVPDSRNKARGILLFDLAVPSAPTEWTKQERVFSVPQGTNSICIRIRRYGWMERPSDWANPVKAYPAGGTVWIDCMWLVPAA
jgi:hypothetical protein